MSKVLWWVIKGLALAPPGSVCKIGVSTSRYPLLLRKSLIRLIILVLFMKVSLTCGFTIKSTYLCLYLCSVSLNSSYVFPSESSFGRGKGRKDLFNKVKSLTKTVFSPTFVVKSSPFMPMISPISRSGYGGPAS